MISSAMSDTEATSVDVAVEYVNEWPPPNSAPETSPARSEMTPASAGAPLKKRKVSR